jgi:quercetin dioxygenase-like cupin family protein
MSHAKTNLREVEDQAARHGLSESQEARFARHDLGAEEIYVVLSGSGRVKLEDELVELAPLDAVRVSPGTARGFEAGDDGLEVLIFGPHVESDGELVEDFWGPER